MGILDVIDISLNFGGVSALNGVNIEIEENNIVSIIGPNGAGKTSLLNCINGLYRPSAGRILFEGRDITHQPCRRIAAMGIGRTFQNVELFRKMTVLENLLIGYHNSMDCGPIAGGFFLGKGLRKEIEARKRAEVIIDFLELEQWRKNIVLTIPFGVAKRIELGRALVSDPKVLLLDEPTVGMNMEETEDVIRYILDVHEEWKKTIILIEHDMHVVMDISHKIFVLNFGAKIAEGVPQEIKSDPEVIKAYLGED